MTRSRAVIAALSVVVLGLGFTLLRQSPAEASVGSLVKTVTFRGARFDVVELPLDQFDVAVSWTPGGTRLGKVSGVVRSNAGIFEPGFTPTGLLVSGGKELRPLERAAGAGNFFLQPNGVFALSERGASTGVG